MLANVNMLESGTSFALSPLDFVTLKEIGHVNQTDTHMTYCCVPVTSQTPDA